MVGRDLRVTSQCHSVKENFHIVTQHSHCLTVRGFGALFFGQRLGATVRQNLACLLLKKLRCYLAVWN